MGIPLNLNTDSDDRERWLRRGGARRSEATNVAQSPSLSGVTGPHYLTPVVVCVSAGLRSLGRRTPDHNEWPSLASSGLPSSAASGTLQLGRIVGVELLLDGLSHGAHVHRLTVCERECNQHPSGDVPLAVETRGRLG